MSRDLSVTMGSDVDGFLQLGDGFFNRSCFCPSFLRESNPFDFVSVSVPPEVRAVMGVVSCLIRSSYSMVVLVMAHTTTWTNPSCKTVLVYTFQRSARRKTRLVQAVVFLVT